MGWYADIETNILRLLRQLSRDNIQIVASQKKIEEAELVTQANVEALQEDLDDAVGILDQKLDTIIAYLIPPPPVRLVISITSNQLLNTQGDKKMAKVAKASVDFQLLDNGTATLTATPVDSVGLPTALPAGTAAAVWTTSNAGIVITPNASDPTGLTAVVSPATPPVLLTGAIPTCTVTLADGVTVITGNGDAIDVIAGGPAGFAVVEQ